MNLEAAKVYQAGTDAQAEVFAGFREWATEMLDGKEQEEAIFWLAKLAETYRQFTVAMADHNGAGS